MSIKLTNWLKLIYLNPGEDNQQRSSPRQIPWADSGVQKHGRPRYRGWLLKSSPTFRRLYVCRQDSCIVVANLCNVLREKALPC